MTETTSPPPSKPSEVSNSTAEAQPYDVTPVPTNPFISASESTPAPAAAPPTSPPVSTPPIAAPTTTATTPPASTTPAPTQNEPELHPQIAALKAMFPDFDIAILQDVLTSANGDQDRAIDTLLGMSDPEYVSTEPPPAPVSQTELDEQLARRLVLEDQQAAQLAWQQQPQDPGVPYEARRGRHSGHRGVHPTNAPAAGERDAVGEFQEGFNRFADTSKKTFSTIFSKVKTKIQEFDQGRQGQGQGSYNTGGTQPSWGSGVVGGQPQGQSQQHNPQQQQSYYDPNAHVSPSPPSSYSPNAPPQVPRPAEGYNISSPPGVAPPITSPRPTATTTSPPTDTATSQPKEVSPTSAQTPPPPTTSAGAPNPTIDYGKIGLLPKRPVSLLPSQSPPTENQPPSHSQGNRDADSDEELYEDPFGVGKK